MKLTKSVIVLLLTFGSSWALAAAGSGGWSIGANLGFINADQDDMNKVIDAASATTGASEFGNAWEFNGHITYRLSGGSTALSFRPSYFMYEDEDGTSASYTLTGFTIFPTLKWYMLEDQTIKFFSQFGVGYGHMSGSIEESGEKVEFSGGDLGYLAGLGAEFCFFGDHCINIEGSVRFLSVERMIADSATGDGTIGTKIDQANKGDEVEINGRDFAASMSGVLGMIGYTMYF
jgi:hypothetical protein